MFLRKSAISQHLMRGTAKQHGFLHIGANLVAKRALGQIGADPPHFHMHIGNIGQFFKIRVFRKTNVGLCVDGPCKTTGHLQNTPGTPAMDFLLGASGSQCALYAPAFRLLACTPIPRTCIPTPPSIGVPTPSPRSDLGLHLL